MPASPEKHKTMCRPHPLSDTDGYKKSSLLAGGAGVLGSFSGGSHPQKILIAEIAKDSWPPVAALKLNGPTALRNPNQLPEAGGKIIIQPSEMTRFNLNFTM